MLDSFFINNMLESAEEQGIALTDDLNVYISKLLVKLSSSSEASYDDKAVLADIYMKVLISKELQEKTRLMKKMGDTSIIKLGFFPDSINKVLSFQYYKDMGIMGYRHVFESTNIPVYNQICDRYDDCVDVIDGVRLLSAKNDIIRLYEAWIKTKSRFARSRLIKLGMVIGKEGRA
jgi:hypothetical protein